MPPHHGEHQVDRVGSHISPDVQHAIAAHDRVKHGESRWKRRRARCADVLRSALRECGEYGDPLPGGGVPSTWTRKAWIEPQILVDERTRLNSAWPQGNLVYCYAWVRRTWLNLRGLPAFLDPEAIEHFDPPADIRGTRIEQPFLITRSLVVKFFRGAPVPDIIRELAAVRILLGADRYYLGEFFTMLADALPEVTPVEQMGALTKAITEYEESRARKELAQKRQAETQAQRTGLLEALRAAENFIDERDGISNAEFAESWAPLWIVVGEKARGCGIQTLSGVEFPQVPALSIAKVLLELAVTNAPADKLARAISGAIERMKGPGGDLWALRHVFVIVRDHLVPRWTKTEVGDHAVSAPADQSKEARAFKEEPPAAPSSAGTADSGHIEDEGSASDPASNPKEEMIGKGTEVTDGAAPAPHPWKQRRTGGMPLRGWEDICDELDVTSSRPRREQLKRLNEATDGPIRWFGDTPEVDRGELRAWIEDTKGRAEAMIEIRREKKKVAEDLGEREGARAQDYGAQMRKPHGKRGKAKE